MTHIRESLINFKVKFYPEFFDKVRSETHITYEINTIDEANRLVKYCNQNNIKLIAIEFNSNGRGKQYQYMVTHKSLYPLRYLWVELATIAESLEINGFVANRLKVEVDEKTLPERLKKFIMYYEMHLNCKSDTKDKVDVINEYLLNRGYKRTHNMNKDDSTVCLLTKRYPIHDQNTILEYNQLRYLGITSNKMEIEAIIYDSNIELDKDW